MVSNTYISIGNKDQIKTLALVFKSNKSNNLVEKLRKDLETKHFSSHKSYKKKTGFISKI